MSVQNWLFRGKTWCVTSPQLLTSPPKYLAAVTIAKNYRWITGQPHRASIVLKSSRHRLDRREYDIAHVGKELPIDATISAKSWACKWEKWMGIRMQGDNDATLPFALLIIGIREFYTRFQNYFYCCYSVDYYVKNPFVIIFCPANPPQTQGRVAYRRYWAEKKRVYIEELFLVIVNNDILQKYNNAT